MKRIIWLICLIIAMLFTASPVLADTADPDSHPTVEEVNVYRNDLETGDMFFLIYANIPYATPPDTAVTQTFIWSLIDTDNTTVLGTTIGYSYNADGYGYNVYSMYFDSDNVTDLGMVWGANYILRLEGNPAVFDDPPSYDFPISTSSYSTLTDSDDVKTELAAQILTLALDLDTQWGLEASESLLVELEAGTALSIYGQAFFRGAIYGVQSLAPAIFPVQIRNLEVTEREWDTGYSENLTSQASGTWIDTAQAAGKTLFGTEYDLMSIIILLILCGGLFIGNIMLAGDGWSGWIDVALMAVIGARLAMYDFGFLLLIGAICWLYISGIIWFRFIR